MLVSNELSRLALWTPSTVGVFSPRQTIWKAAHSTAPPLPNRKLDTKRRFPYADDDGLAHVWLDSSGNEALTARELLDFLDSDSVIGFSRLLRSVPSNVYTTVSDCFERQY